MKTIEIEDDLYKIILNNIEEFGETPSDILRRLILPKTPIQTEVNISNKAFEPKITKKTINLGSDLTPLKTTGTSLKNLFNDDKFQNTKILTTKFKKMLETMYFENKEAFIFAAEKAKGRSRSYLGKDLDSLLNSKNKEEVELLIASKPREIPNTPYWVMTNANTNRKRIILTKMMSLMGYEQNLIDKMTHIFPSIQHKKINED